MGFPCKYIVYLCKCTISFVCNRLNVIEIWNQPHAIPHGKRVASEWLLLAYFNIYSTIDCSDRPGFEKTSYWNGLNETHGWLDEMNCQSKVKYSEARLPPRPLHGHGLTYIRAWIIKHISRHFVEVIIHPWRNDYLSASKLSICCPSPGTCYQRIVHDACILDRFPPHTRKSLHRGVWRDLASVT